MPWRLKLLALRIELAMARSKREELWLILHHSSCAIGRQQALRSFNELREREQTLMAIIESLRSNRGRGVEERVPDRLPKNGVRL